MNMPCLWRHFVRESLSLLSELLLFNGESWCSKVSGIVMANGIHALSVSGRDDLGYINFF